MIKVMFCFVCFFAKYINDLLLNQKQWRVRLMRRMVRIDALKADLMVATHLEQPMTFYKKKYK